MIARARPAGLIVFEDPVFFAHRPRIIDFVARHRIPTFNRARPPLGVLTQHARPHRARKSSLRHAPVPYCTQGYGCPTSGTSKRPSVVSMRKVALHDAPEGGPPQGTTNRAVNSS